jgi:alkylated DNA repair dioxygenase AlkB
VTRAAQSDLFDIADALPPGLSYRPEFITPGEEEALLGIFADLPFHEALFQQYTARRRVVRYGEGEYPASYGAAAEEANPRRPFPDFLVPLRTRVAAWRGVPEASFVHALITEYRPGTPIGWHSDAPHFERVVGISLAGAADALSSVRREERSQRGDRARARPAIRVCDGGRRPLALAAPYSADARASLLDHVPHPARRRTAAIVFCRRDD